MFEKIDIKGGQMTYAQRIELGQIFASGKPESRIFREMFACLAPDHTVKFSVKEVEYYNEVIEGLLYWINRETKELQYKPTSDELAAGIRELSRLVGDMGTLTSLAEKFSKDPDEILQWKYGKVYNILYTNKESYLYSRRYNDVIMQKSKARK